MAASEPGGDTTNDQRPFVVICNSGYASEVVAIITAAGSTVAAIYGTGAARTSAATLGIDFIEAEASLANLPTGVRVALASSPPDIRAELHRQLVERGQPPHTLIHPDTTIGVAVVIGDGTIVSPGARLTADIHIGTCCLIHTGAVLSHDDRIGDYVTVSPNATITGGVTIEPRATIGAGATVLPNTTIGAGATVGAGAAVTRDVADRNEAIFK